MSFSSVRRWFTRSNHGTAGVTPQPSAPEAAFLRGLSFANGDGVTQDYVRAAECYTEAAQQDHSFAQLNLAVLYERGQGVERDLTKAQVWLTKSAYLGNAAAQYRLGVQEHLACRTLQGGAAVEGRIEALKWVQLAAAQALSGAESACEFVALGMTQEEVAEGDRRAARFMTRPGADLLVNDSGTPRRLAGSLAAPVAIDHRLFDAVEDGRHLQS